MSVAGRSAAAAAERVARESYGRLVAWLAWQWRDLAAAEDALAEAFAAALAHWPESGVPDHPEAWLIKTAKRHLLMAARRRRLAEDPAFLALLPGVSAATEERQALPDLRLRLMLLCAHPAIDPAIHSALMLQVVLGVEAARIARAFLVSPEAMARRLSRAKAKIRDARIRFEPPDREDLAPRVAAVLEAIYGAYTLGADGAMGEGSGDLADEAVYLAELVVAHLPDDAEANGLLALLWLAESRRGGRHDADGAFVPLEKQDVSCWDGALIAAADRRLAHAAARNARGAFQLEAAIQAAHIERLRGGAASWSDIVRLYEHLLDIAPTAGARVGHAVAVAQARADPGAGLALLQAIDAAQMDKYQPWWAARAYLHARIGEMRAAAAAWKRALALTHDPARRRYLEGELGLARAACEASPMVR